MRYTIEAACGSHVGKIRQTNQDNFCFEGKYLEAEHDGASDPILSSRKLKNGDCIAVFDGMGGENFGEIASFAAARGMAETKRTLVDHFRSTEKYLHKLAEKLNCAVLTAKEEMRTTRMGTTMVSLFYDRRFFYVCNVGDSRAYCLSDGELVQLSQDHVEARSRKPGKKPPLTQHLGIDPEDMLIEPYIMKRECQTGDWYLLCSDGLTDMLTDLEITDIMDNSKDSLSCVNRLIEAALAHGGRDNITAIVFRII